jgi:hypothetical protein
MAQALQTLCRMQEPTWLTSGDDPMEADPSMGDQLAEDPGSYQSNHATTGMRTDDEHADTNTEDAKVQGQSRP